MNRKLILPATFVAAFIAVLFLATLWQPERQLRLHQRNVFRAVENREWDRVGHFFADNYLDRWGHDKEFVLRQANVVFRQFISCTVERKERDIGHSAGSGHVSMHLRIEGAGGPLAHLAMQRVNSLTEPFTFRWRKRSWQPWNWALVEVNQPELEIPESLRE